MSLTPEQIASQEFAVGLRGYDQDEVRDYLRKVASLVAAGGIVLTDVPGSAAGPASPVKVDAPSNVVRIGAAASASAGVVGEAEPLDPEVDANPGTAPILQRAHAEAAEIRQSATAEAEITRARARSMLVAAQEEVLRLIAEAHARIDRRSDGTSPDAGAAASSGSTIEQLGEEISAMVRTRDDVLAKLQELQRSVEEAVQAVETDPVLGRASSLAGQSQSH